MPGPLDIESKRTREDLIVDQFVELQQTGGDVSVAGFLELFPGASVRLVCDLILLDQQFRWRSGNGVKSEHYLTMHDRVATDTELCLDIIYGEHRVRSELGENFTAQQWVDRFPAFAGEIRKQFEVSQWWNAADDPAETTTQLKQDTVLRPAVVDAEAPLAFDDFRLVKQLGDGAMGEVHLAVQKSLNKKVALKILKHTGREAPERIERFLQEARIAASLNHPQLTEVHGVGRCPGGGYFLVMDFAQGRNLQECLEEKPFAVEEAARIVRQVAAAIQFAHDRGIIHRDIKPSNILYDGDNGVKVVDFGLAKHLEPMHPDISSPRQIVGTPHFMAPEQADPRWGKVKPTTDVFALGALLYTLVSGSPPFQGVSNMEVLAALVSDRRVVPLATRTPGVCAAVDQICGVCLQKDPDKRYATAGEVAQTLQDFLESGSRHGQSAHYRRIGWLAAAAAMMLLTAASAWWFWPTPKTTATGDVENADASGSEAPPLRDPSKNAVADAGWSVELFPQDKRLPPAALLEKPAAVHSGDALRLRLRLTPPRYVYVFWLGSDGSVSLLYPKGGDVDEPTQEVLLPDDGRKGFPVHGEAGTEVCVALLRNDPLPDFAKLAAGLKTALPPPDIPEGSLLVDGKFYTEGFDESVAPFMKKLTAGSRPVGEAEPLAQLAIDGWVSKWRNGLPFKTTQLSYVAIPHRQRIND